MKLERISENQIRCTLNRSDLTSRQIKLSELAYGSGKTRELFRDMMIQASNELGFEADDIPLMIEAIPVSSECIVLVITKVDNPDELDRKFSEFLPDEDDDAGDADFIDNGFEFDDAEDVTDESDKFTSADVCYNDIKYCTYSFDSLSKIIKVAKMLPEDFDIDNSLYKSPQNGRYYLVLSSKRQNRGTFYNAINILSEFGDSEHSSYAIANYFSEHYEHILISDALQNLAKI